MDEQDNYLMLSGLQHYAYCRRQWALIHIEQQWAENVRTVDGNLFHSRAHNTTATEKRGDILITRGLSVKSEQLKMTGICDVVEFHKDKNGITLFGYPDTWLPYPIEYKRGAPKTNNADKLQLCGQAMCLEEMLLCDIHEGSLFYGETRRRFPVIFTEELRDSVKKAAAEMHDLWERGHTPKAKMHKGCNACSLKEICLPKLGKAKKVSAYIDERIAGE